MNTKNSVFSNMVWRFAERCGAQLITFVVSIVLARLLAPEDYGKIALITVFTTILQVFVDSGLGTALIQKKDSDDLDFSSVFYFNFIVCLSMITSMIINSWPNRQLLNYSFKEQMIDIFPSVTLAVVMGIAISFINFFEFSSALTLLIKVPTGALIYIFGSKLLHLDSFEYLLEISKTLIHKK